MKRYSAIDIGSNAIRMVIVEKVPFTSDRIKILKKYRAPIRLGSQVFISGKISEEDICLAEQAFRDFQSKNIKYKVDQCRVVATSATRDASNKMEFIDRIYKASGLKIQVIDGIEEAHLIHQAVNHKYDLSQKNVLLLDIGGGSVEVSFNQGAQMTSTQSFPLGTVRLLDQLKKLSWGEDKVSLVIAKQLGPLTKHIHANIDHTPVSISIGTGGNLEFLLDFRNSYLSKKPRQYFTYQELLKIIQIFKNTPLKDRIEKFNMKKDRADVILPACIVAQTILHQSEVERVYIPKVGLREGVICSLIKEHNFENSP